MMNSALSAQIWIFSFLSTEIRPVTILDAGPVVRTHDKYIQQRQVMW